ncbi:related to NADPH:quinone reductase and related Zn-dependent oxidoreductases [Phialocephala subalpina]|uniref:Related to NADPH:quinone reductase and related Zn-dependent oxidoreductases n=1 Tax=Phialocephala subalpina TaxID=576137 RepID=A0A1L7XPR1_9HELO|nr:related to NADPH:quinone reductase and related Zn-dependent oxidoreductases [Phialocephala subalpina]
MQAIGVSHYGPPSNFEIRQVSLPSQPTGRDLLIQVKALSVNPIDTKIRAGKYDDAPDYYDHVPHPFHIIAPEAAGIVLSVGPDAQYFRPGDSVFYVSAPTRQGAAAEYQLVDERTIGHKPTSLDFVEAAVMPLTYGTAWEMAERLDIQEGEQAGILIINGAGGVGSVATQLARYVLRLPVVVATASRPETKEWVKQNGATHVIDHREDLKTQIDNLGLDVPIKYIFILASTEQYLSVASDICAPLGKICSIVQSSVNFYGTQFLSKSLTFAWCWLGSRGYHDYDREAQHVMMENLAKYIDEGKIHCTLTKRMKLTAEGLKTAHELIESKKTIGKIGLGVDEEGEREPFA